MIKKVKDLITILIIFFSILIFMNIIIFLFNYKLVKQELFKRNVLSHLPISYQIFYPKINDRKYSDYIAIIGDSHALGVGDGYFDLNIEKYSIAHFLNEKNPETNFITLAWPGGGSISHLKLFDLINDRVFFKRTKEYPKKIVYLFSEENDFTDDFNDKYFNIKTYAFTKKEYIKQIFPLFYYVYRLIKSNFPTKKNKKINFENKIKFNEKEINIPYSAGLSVPEVNDEDLLKTLSIIKDNLKIFKNKVEDITFLYIPSFATTNKMKDPIISLSVKDKKIIKTTNHKMNLYNHFASTELKKICDSLDINFIDLTEDLSIKAEQELIYGPNDWTHFNIKGQKYIAELLNSKILE